MPNDQHKNRLRGTSIARVCDYIQQNLDEELTLHQLSHVAGLSKFHFQRVFTSLVGVSPAKFYQLARLKRASFVLAFEINRKVIDIAFEAGFESPEAFARAFKRAFGQSPSEFRSAPDWPQWDGAFQFQIPKVGESEMRVDIVNFEETPVALIEHKGPPERVYETAERFIAWRRQTGLSPVATSQTFGVPYGDPKVVAPEDFRFHICGAIRGDVPKNPQGVTSGTIPGGRCARVRHSGSHDLIEDGVSFLYRDWLPQSGESLRDFPVFFEYLNFVHDVDECDLETDIYLPLKSCGSAPLFTSRP